MSKNPTKGATTAVDAGHGRGMLWTLLILCGGVSGTLSLVHGFAVAEKLIVDPAFPMDDWVAYLVAVLYGATPVTVAASLAHIISRGGSKLFELGLTWLVMLGAMVISLVAQAATLAPFVADMKALAYVFPLVMDLSTVVALNKLMAAEAGDMADQVLGHTAAGAKNEGVARDMAKPAYLPEPATSVAILTGGQIPMAKNVANPAPVAMATTMASGQTVGQNSGHGQVATPADGHGHLAKTAAMATTVATPSDGQKASGHVATSAPVAKPVAKKVATAKPVATVPAPRPGAGGTSATEVLARLALSSNPAMSVEDLAVAIGKSTRTARRLRPIILAEMADGHVATDKSTKLASGHVARPMANEMATAKSVAKPANGQMATTVAMAKTEDGHVAMAKTEDGHVAMAKEMATPSHGQTAMATDGQTATTDDGHDNEVATVTELATYSRVR